LVLKNYDPPFQKRERYQRSILLLPNNSVTILNSYSNGAIKIQSLF
jgi:hypothetical protein